MVEIGHPARRLSGCPCCNGRNLRQRVACRCFLRGVAKAFNVRPSVVAPGDDAVDFVVVGRPVFAQIQMSAVRERQALGVAMAVAVHPIAKRVVRRRIPIPIHPKHLAPEVVYILGNHGHVHVSRAEVHVSIWPLLKAAAIVGAVARQLIQQRFARHHQPFRQAVSQLVEPPTKFGIGVVDVEVGLRRKVRVQHHGMRPAVVEGLVDSGNLVNLLHRALVWMDARDAPRFFHAPDVVVRTPHQIPGHRQLLGHVVQQQIRLGQGRARDQPNAHSSQHQLHHPHHGVKITTANAPLHPHRTRS